MRGEHIPERRPVPVEIGFVNGESAKGKLWISAGKSPIDTLNSQQSFLEFTPYGEQRTRCLAKAHIATLTPVDMPKSIPLYDRRGLIDVDDPYHILSVHSGATWQTIREAYLVLAKSYHPDRYASVPLPDEVRDYLGAKARRINAAYALLESSLHEAVVNSRNAAR